MPFVKLNEDRIIGNKEVKKGAVVEVSETLSIRYTNGKIASITSEEPVQPSKKDNKQKKKDATKKSD